MKRNILMILAMLSTFILSCSNEQEFPPKPTSKIVLVDKANEELLFDENQGSRKVDFKSAKPWTADVVEEEAKVWLNVTPTNGKEGDVYVLVNVEQNDTPNERKASILLKSGVTKQLLKVNQKPANAILLSPSNVDIEAKGGTYSLVAKATETCSATVAEACKSWISITSTKSVATAITYVVAENTGIEQRKGEIYVNNDKASETVYITQAGAAPKATPSKTSFEFSEDGGEIEFDVETNLSNFTVTVKDSPEWIVADASNVGSKKTFKYTALANETVHERTATILVENTEYSISEAVTIRQSGKKGDGDIRILAIGNSFSDDAMEYLYDILKAAGFNSIKLGNLYIGGCSLATHASNMTNNSASYDYRVNVDGKWVTTSKFVSADAIKSDNWDYISMQQASHDSGLPETYMPYLSTLVDAVKELCPKAKLMWHMTWAYQSTSTHSGFANYGNDQMTMYNAIIDAVKTEIVTNSNFDFVIPCGTAIQNLRTSIFGDNLTRDGYHLSYSVGRFVAALMWAKQIAGADINAIDWIPTGNIYTKNQLAAIKEAVNNAYEHPYEVTSSTITSDDEDINKTLETVISAGGYNPFNYERLEFDLIHPGYYNSSSNIPSTVQTNMKNYATTRIFEKSEFPDGTLIVQKAGYSYRPEGWVAVDQKNSARPDNCSAQIIEVNESWWGSFNFRAFNIAKTGVGDLTSILDEVEESFGIFIPKPEPENAELEKIITDAGKDVSKYKALIIQTFQPAYYNSQDANKWNQMQTNMKSFACTQVFKKSQIPNGSLIVLKDGFQYRPDAWADFNVKNTLYRPGNVKDTLVEVDDAWWDQFNYRAFNIQKIGVSDLGPIMDEVNAAFGIYVPRE